MPQPLVNDLGVHIGEEEQGRAGVAQSVKADGWQSGRFRSGLKVSREVGERQVGPHGVDEHNARPHVSPFREYCPAVRVQGSDR